MRVGARVAAGGLFFFFSSFFLYFFVLLKGRDCRSLASPPAPGELAADVDGGGEERGAPVAVTGACVAEWDDLGATQAGSAGRAAPGHAGARPRASGPGPHHLHLGEESEGVHTGLNPIFIASIVRRLTLVGRPF